MVHVYVASYASGLQQVGPDVNLVKVFPAALGQATPGQERRDLQNLEREHIVRVLEDTGWRIRGKHAAADILGLKPTTLEPGWPSWASSAPAPPARLDRGGSFVVVTTRGMNARP